MIFHLDNCGLDVLVDDEDWPLIEGYNWWGVQQRNTWYAKAWHKYGVKHYQRTKITMHRVILDVENPRIWVDHIDGNGLNNQRSNLRVATYSENAVNRRITGFGTSQYMGVAWHKASGKWRVKIDGKWIGTYADEVEAAKVYDYEAIQRHGRFARVNFLSSWGEAK